MSISRDIQIKEIKSMYRALHGNYPYHLDFNSMDDDQIDHLFDDMSAKLYDKEPEQDDDWRQYVNNQEAPKNVSSFMVLNNIK
jgi:hypothetical protein